MKTAWSLLFMLAASWFAAAQPAGTPRLIDDGWRFHRGDQPGAEQPGFNDSQWRTVDLPHDWSIEDLPGTQSPFSPDAISGVSGGFTTGGTGWYRKKLVIPAAAGSRGHVLLLFEGVYMNADVWLNGKHLGNHPYGYTSFWYDITDSLQPGATNVVSVRVKNEGKNSRWYAGSGIYRHVWLKYEAPVHVTQWGTYITTPEVSEAQGRVQIRTRLVNDSRSSVSSRLVTRILAPNGRQVAMTETARQISAGEDAAIQQQLTVPSPQLWSTGSPALYTAVQEVYQGGGQPVSLEKVRFGIRSLSFDAVNGFRLNGKTLKLKGGCVHHDNGPLGAQAFDRAEERKVQLLLQSGYNAVRCAHNPPSPAFLDACDRLGMLVIDEAFDTWDSPKNKQDYNLYFNEWWQRDLESMVYRDRNHPSVIMWSIGNEIPHREKPEVAALAAKLSSYIRILDSTRPVTAGVNGVAPDKDPFFAALDVAGYNYELKRYDSDHVRLPDRVIFATESFPLESFDYWMGVLDRSWVIGDFVWTAYDYIGEASIGWLGYPQNKDFYPWNLAYCGDIDVCGWKRPQSYYRDAFWNETPNISLFVKPPKPSFDRTNPKPEPWSRWNWQDVVADWNWTGFEKTPIPVEVYTNCEEAELFLNGKSLGKKSVGRATRFIAGWTVPYEAGTLRVVGYKGGQKAGEATLVTTSQPDHLQLRADRKLLKAGGQDLCYVTVELQDAQGNRHPKAANEITFTVDGPASIAGVGNADPMSVESCRQPHRKAWQGRCLVILRTGKNTGKITLKASTQGMKPALVTLQAK